MFNQTLTSLASRPDVATALMAGLAIDEPPKYRWGENQGGYSGITTSKSVRKKRRKAQKMARRKNRQGKK